MPNVPYPYEVNWQLVMENGSLSNVSLSKHSLSPSLTVVSDNKSAEIKAKSADEYPSFQTTINYVVSRGERGSKIANFTQ